MSAVSFSKHENSRKESVQSKIIGILASRSNDKVISIMMTPRKSTPLPMAKQSQFFVMKYSSEHETYKIKEEREGRRTCRALKCVVFRSPSRKLFIFNFQQNSEKTRYASLCVTGRACICSKLLYLLPVGIQRIRSTSCE